MTGKKKLYGFNDQNTSWISISLKDQMFIGYIDQGNRIVDKILFKWLHYYPISWRIINSSVQAQGGNISKLTHEYKFLFKFNPQSGQTNSSTITN